MSLRLFFPQMFMLIINLIFPNPKVEKNVPSFCRSP